MGELCLSPPPLTASRSELSPDRWPAGRRAPVMDGHRPVTAGERRPGAVRAEQTLIPDTEVGPALPLALQSRGVAGR